MCKNLLNKEINSILEPWTTTPRVKSLASKEKLKFNHNKFSAKRKSEF